MARIPIPSYSGRPSGRQRRRAGPFYRLSGQAGIKTRIDGMHSRRSRQIQFTRINPENPYPRHAGQNDEDVGIFDDSPLVSEKTSSSWTRSSWLSKATKQTAEEIKQRFEQDWRDKRSVMADALNNTVQLSCNHSYGKCREETWTLTTIGARGRMRGWLVTIEHLFLIYS
jgi:hypothetical protein